MESPEGTGKQFMGGDIASGDATYVFWVMRYLGDDNAQVMDGGLDDWITASLPLESGPNVRKPTEYEPKTRQELLADYDYVKAGKAQLVDARPFQEFGKERIPGSISIDSAQLLEDGKVKDSAQLNNTFSGLSKNKPVVIYSENLLNASLVWYALQLMGTTHVFTPGKTGWHIGPQMAARLVLQRQVLVLRLLTPANTRSWGGDTPQLHFSEGLT